MNKNLGNNEASGFRNKSSAIMIVSIIAVTLFIGTALQPAIASPLPEIGSDVGEKGDECTLCRPVERPAETKPNCKTCVEAINHAVFEVMPDYVITKLSEIEKPYVPLMMDFALWVLEGIKEGIKESGFKINFDEDELWENIVYWVNISYQKPGHNITKLIGAIHGISIGIRTYLLTCCNPNEEESKSAYTKQMGPLRQIISIVFSWINKLKQLVK